MSFEHKPTSDQPPGDPQLMLPDTLSTLHPSSIIFEVLSHGRRHLLPAAMAVIGAASGNWFWIAIASFAFVTSLIGSAFRYATMRYGVHAGELVVKEGLLFRRTRTIPVNRIQNIDLVQNVFHRIFHVAEVKIETASGSEPEASLRVITMSQVDSLRQEVFEQRKVESEPVDAIIVSDDEPLSEVSSFATQERAAPPILEIPTSWLVRAGLASNRGLVLVSLILGLLAQFDMLDYDYIDFDRLERFLPNSDSLAGVAITVGVGAVLFLLLMRVVGIVWFILRFHGYQLSRYGDDLRISCGLFTKVSATIPRKRIQFISIHRPLLLRWMRLCSLRLETAGGSATENEDASSTISRRWFIPVLHEDRVDQVLQELRPNFDWDEATFDWQGVSRKTARRLVRMSLLRAVVICLIGLAITRPWGFTAGLAIFPIDLYLSLRASRAMRYARTPFGLAYRSGYVRRILSITFFERLQTLSVTQTPFDRRWTMATLVADTAGAGPAGHRIVVRFLDEEFAKREFNALNEQAAKHQPVWN